MKILLLSNWFPPITSGSSYYTYSLAQALTQRGHQLVVVTLDWGKNETADEPCPYPVYRLPVRKLPKMPLFFNLELMGFAFTPGNIKRLRKIIEEQKPDLIHHVNHIFDTNFLSTLAAKMCKLPIVGSITTPVQHENKWMHVVYSVVDRFTIGWFGVRLWDGIVSLDKEVHGYVGKVYGNAVQKRSAIVPFGVPLQSLSLYERGHQNFSPRPQILTVGHIHPFRNPVMMVRAMPLVLKEVPDARLVIAGRLDLQEPVKVAESLGLNREYVDFKGEISHDQSIQMMKESHIFAMWGTGPYLGLGTAAMEAMLCETPVINDLPEDLFGESRLVDGENIIIVNSKDRRAVADSMIRLLKDSGLRRRIGANGRKFVLDHLSWDSIAGKMERFYEKILEPRTAFPMSRA